MLAEDREALHHVAIQPSTATYKLVQGVSFQLHKGLVSKLKKFPFSLTFDEAPTNNHKKVFGTLASFVNTDSPTPQIEVHHLASVEVWK